MLQPGKPGGQILPGRESGNADSGQGLGGENAAVNRSQGAGGSGPLLQDLQPVPGREPAYIFGFQLMGLQRLHQPLKLGAQRGDFRALGSGSVRHFVHGRLLNGHCGLILDGVRRAPKR